LGEEKRRTTYEAPSYHQVVHSAEYRLIVLLTSASRDRVDQGAPPGKTDAGTPPSETDEPSFHLRGGRPGRRGPAPPEKPVLYHVLSLTVRAQSRAVRPRGTGGSVV
jgi:hypothetical protein